MITGGEIRRYRKILGLHQVEVARRIGISQSALSGLESGRIALSDDHLASLKEKFSAPSFNPPFVDFLRGLESNGKAQDLLHITNASRYLTLTVWRWHDGIDLSRVPPPDQAVGLVTIPVTDRATLAFEMPGPGTKWKKGDVLVFSECKPFELKPGEPCIVQFRLGKRSQSSLGLAEPKESKIQIRSGRGATREIPKDAVTATFREELRMSRADRS